MEAKARFKNPLTLSVIGFPSFIHTVCKQKLGFFKNSGHLKKTQLFIKKPGLFIKNSVFTLYGSGPVFQKTGLFSTFFKIPCFFQNSVFLKIPCSRDRPFSQKTGLFITFLKFRVFQKIPCF